MLHSGNGIAGLIEDCVAYGSPRALGSDQALCLTMLKIEL